MKKIISTISVMAAMATMVFVFTSAGKSDTPEEPQFQMPQPGAEPKAPELEYCLQLKVALGQAYSVGQTPKGSRNIVPITGGTFEGKLPGKELKGEIIPGGADYQMSNGGRTEIEAIYCIKTDDGVTIHVRNCGLICMSDGMYFRCSPKFEAPEDSKYNWMNNSLFLCQPSFGGAGGGITLDVWRVK